MAQPSKSILVFCDGTGLDGIAGLESVDAGSHEKPVTNVLRLSRTVTQYRGAKGAVPRIPQIVLYQPGVGSQAGFEPQNKTVNTLLSGGIGEEYNKALGQFVASKIREVYAFIAQNYVAGDLICLFGYSRGAYTARKVAGIIDRVGILSGKELYSFSEKLLDSNYRTPHPEVKVKCVGVWDTVGSVRTVEVRLGNPSVSVVDAYNIRDASLPPNVENAFHAVSLQENRSNFLPTLWDEIKQPNGGQVLEQVWFLGDHGDVGGGHQNLDLSDISLVWMAEKIRKFVDLDQNKLEYYFNRSRGAGWGESQPNNAFLSLSALVRTVALFRTEKRNSLWEQRQDVLVHLSCEKAVVPKRGYEILQPSQLPGFGTRPRANFEGFEKTLRDDKQWKTVDPKRVVKPDTSGDNAAIGADNIKHGVVNVLDGKILTGGAQAVGGAIDTSAALVQGGLNILTSPFGRK